MRPALAAPRLFRVVPESSARRAPGAAQRGSRRGRWRERPQTRVLAPLLRRVDGHSWAASKQAL